MSIQIFFNFAVKCDLNTFIKFTHTVMCWMKLQMNGCVFVFIGVLMKMVIVYGSLRDSKLDMKELS